MGGHIAAIWRIRVNHPSTAASALRQINWTTLLSLDTPTYRVAQIAERFEPNTVLWAFRTWIQYSHLVTLCRYQI